MRTNFDVNGVRLGMAEPTAIKAAKTNMPKRARFTRLRYGNDEVGYRDVGFKLSCEDFEAGACREIGSLEVYAPEGKVISVRREWKPQPPEAFPTSESVMGVLREKYPGVIFDAEHRDGGVVGYRSDLGFMPNATAPNTECEPFLAVSSSQSPCSVGMSIGVMGESDANSELRIDSVSIFLADIAANTKFESVKATASLAHTVTPKL